MKTGLLALMGVAVALGSWVGVAVIRGYALRRLLDVPNDRSSHSRPTPRGGGLALTLAHVVGLMVIGLLELVSSDLVAALLGGGLVVAFIGFLDDHGHVNPLVRLTCHFSAFLWTLWWLGGLPPVDFGWGPVDLYWAGTVLLLLYLVWFLNLFNFMDGIDGIAGIQALTMCTMAAALIQSAGGDPAAALPVMLLAAATAGFLAWNWPPAKIFMGDVGSGYLGYALGTLAIWTVVEGWLTPWVWLILGGAFLADATVTLFARARAKVALFEAHRSHAYQRLSRHWRGHLPVTLAFTAVNVLWLGPWAYIATRWQHVGFACALFAIVPLFVIAARLGAGRSGEMSGRA